MDAAGVCTSSPDEILLSLRRSRARRLVLLHLSQISMDFPASVARATGLTSPATLGALRGLGKRYAFERSLVGLGLAREISRVPNGVQRYYALTATGREVADALRGELEPAHA